MFSQIFALATAFGLSGNMNDLPLAMPPVRYSLTRSAGSPKRTRGASGIRRGPGRFAMHGHKMRSHLDPSPSLTNRFFRRSGRRPLARAYGHHNDPYPDGTFPTR